MITYTRNELLQYRRGAGLPSAHIPEEVWRRPRRGRRAGAKVQERIERDRKMKPFLPTIIMGNVRSLANKVDELSALVNNQRAYRECSLLCFTETWLNGNIPDSLLELAGFSLVRADRGKQSGKKRGGGLAVFVNCKWCNPGHVTVKECICTPDIELLAVGLRPYYLPREFSHAIAVIVYIPPSAAARSASDVIHSTIARLQTQHPSALIMINGDFNHVPLSPVLTNFKQYVNCATRENKILDLFYVNVKGAYSSSALPPLGESDHNLIHLVTTYKPLAMQQRASKRTVKVWSKEAEETLQECFQDTIWELFQEDFREDIEGLSRCITDYICFCEDTIVPTKKVHYYGNNKPWINKDIKGLLNRKKRAFMAKDREELRAVQKELKRKLREAKNNYREKIEAKMGQNNTKEVWNGMKCMTSFSLPSPATQGDPTFASELNLFFNRFDTTPTPVCSDSKSRSPLTIPAPIRTSVGAPAPLPTNTSAPPPLSAAFTHQRTAPPSPISPPSNSIALLLAQDILPLPPYPPTTSHTCLGAHSSLQPPPLHPAPPSPPPRYSGNSPGFRGAKPGDLMTSTPGC